MSDGDRYDFAIVGGGLVGASLALALRGRRVALIEAAVPPANAASWDERCIALNAASQRIFETLGVWPLLAPHAQPIRSTHISERGRFGVARFTAEDAGLPALGWNIPVRALTHTLWQQARDQAGVDIFCPAQLQTMERHADHIELRLPSPASRITAQLLIAADGAQSATRTQLGIGAREEDYGQSAIVTAVRLSRPHHACAYERFTPEGPIALLPKAGDTCSLVWTLPNAEADAMLALDDAAFMQAAQTVFGERLGRFTALGARKAWPLSRVLSERLTAPRALLAGNAAQSLHPVAAQGFNLGLRDVAAIADVFASATDPGTDALLEMYAARRAADRRVVSGFTDGLVRLFSNRVPGLAGLRHLGLLALDLTPPLKQAVLWQNLGYGTAAPARVRSA